MTDWIGVDFDGTLSEYHGWSPDGFGPPIQPMLERVKRWLEQGYTVKILTARVAHNDPYGARKKVGDWCEKHLGRRLEITAEKDMDMLEVWDDRAVGVEMNTGRQLNPSTRGLGDVDYQQEV